MRIASHRPLVALVLALAAVVLGMAAPPTAKAGGACRGIPVTISTGDRVEMRQSCFFPTVLEISAGTTVTWTNSESVAHSVSGANLAWGDYTDHGRGETVTHSFAKPGVYPYYCFLHPGMIGAIVVRDDSHASLGAQPRAGDSADTSDGFPGPAYGILGALAGVVLTGISTALVRRR